MREISVAWIRKKLIAMSWIINERNSLGPIFHIFLIFGSFWTFTLTVPAHRYISAGWLILGLAIFIIEMWVFTKACVADPGTIRKNNVELCLEIYELDYVLFGDKHCETCDFKK